MLKKLLSAALGGAESVVEAAGGESAAIKSLGGYPSTQILGEAFYSQVPLLYGLYMAKISVAPASPELVALAGGKIDVGSKPNALRDSVTDFFSSRNGEWEAHVQLCTDREKIPIEDASVPWPEDESPYLPVARISVAPQESWAPTRSRAVDDGMAFSPGKAWRRTSRSVP